VKISLHHRAQGANGNQPSVIRQTGCKQAGPALHVLPVGTQNVATDTGARDAIFGGDLFPLIIRTPYRRLRTGSREVGVAARSGA